MSNGSSSREDSPDWLRSFQAPTRSVVTLSSGSLFPLSDDEDEINLSKLFQKEKSDSQVRGDTQADKALKPKGRTKTQKAEQSPARKRTRKGDNQSAKGEKRAEEREAGESASEKPILLSEPVDSVWTLSSDSDSFPDSKPEDFTAKTPTKKLKRESDKPPKSEKVNVHKNRETTGDMDVEENLSEKCSALNVSSRLPLVLVDKVQRSKALVECEGDSIDLSGDVGAVGRVVISDDSSGNHEMLLDLKGTIYRTSILPSRTFCVVSFGQSEAKIEAIMNDFIQLKPQANVYEAETMVEGTLDGFLFDSEDEVDNLPKALTNQGDVAEEQSKGKTKQKAEKASGALQKKTKTAGGKKVKKKSQAPKKSRTKK
ncbi:hypothetical protein ACH5RR_017338 [Cinchona calisaya]|uniref:DNA-binding protein BIN4 n=1 Tax=Cinchona calisaya TaxID=153742 RepID=A0ABD2ZYH0_9GENT